MQDCSEDDCTLDVAQSKTLTDEEKKLWLGTFHGMRQMRDHLSEISAAGKARDGVLKKHIEEEKEFQAELMDRLEPVFTSADRWEARRKWVIRGVVTLGLIVAWVLDVFHHLFDVIRGFHNK